MTPSPTGPRATSRQTREHLRCGVRQGNSMSPVHFLFLLSSRVSNARRRLRSPSTKKVFVNRRMIHQTTNDGIHAATAANSKAKELIVRSSALVVSSEEELKKISEGIPREAITFLSHDRNAAKNDKGNLSFRTILKTLARGAAALTNENDYVFVRAISLPQCCREWRMSPHIYQ